MENFFLEKYLDFDEKWKNTVAFNFGKKNNSKLKITLDQSKIGKMETFGLNKIFPENQIDFEKMESYFGI